MNQQSSRSSIATTEFVFIVGVSRSGTTLMRRTLNTSDQIAIASENHFLGHIIASEGMRYKFRKFGDLSNDANVYKLVNFIYSHQFKTISRFRYVSTHWFWLIKHVKKEDFLQRILASDRSERELFMTIMQVYAEYKNKPIKGEKTPAHIRYVSTILQWFPEGRVIHMLRDPRGIFVSEIHRRSNQSQSLPFKLLKHIHLLKPFLVLQTTIIWLESVYRYSKHKYLYPDNYYLLRFEDLVKNPETQIKNICTFLGIEFDNKMLKQVVVSYGFQAGQSGFDARAADRWKDRIDPWTQAWFLFWFKKHLRAFGYIE